MADTRIDIPVTSGLASNGEAGGGAIYNTGSLAINQLLESSIYYDNAWHILWTEPPPTPPPNHSVLILPDHGFVTVKVFAMYALTTSVNGTTNFGNNGANILNIDEGSLEIIWNSITERFELNVAIDYVSVFGNTDKIPILKDIKYNVFRGSSLPNSVWYKQITNEEWDSSNDMWWMKARHEATINTSDFLNLNFNIYVDSGRWPDDDNEPDSENYPSELMIPLYMIVEQNNQFVSMDGIDRFTFLIIVLASRRREFNEDFNVDRFYNLVSFT